MKSRNRDLINIYLPAFPEVAYRSNRQTSAFSTSSSYNLWSSPRVPSCKIILSHNLGWKNSECKNWIGKTCQSHLHNFKYIYIPKLYHTQLDRVSRLKLRSRIQFFLILSTSNFNIHQVSLVCSLPLHKAGCKTKSDFSLAKEMSKIPQTHIKLIVNFPSITISQIKDHQCIQG